MNSKPATTKTRPVVNTMNGQALGLVAESVPSGEPANQG